MYRFFSCLPLNDKAFKKKKDLNVIQEEKYFNFCVLRYYLN